MTDLTIDEMIDILKAYKDGKTVQCKQVHDGSWFDIPNPAFFSSEYRVKPEPREYWVGVDIGGHAIYPVLSGVKPNPDHYQEVIKVREALDD